MLGRLRAIKEAYRTALDEPGEIGPWAAAEELLARTPRELSEEPGAARALVWALWAHPPLAAHAAWILGRLGRSDEVGEQLEAFALARGSRPMSATVLDALVRAAPQRALRMAARDPAAPTSVELAILLADAHIAEAFEILAQQSPPRGVQRKRWLHAFHVLDPLRARDVYLELLAKPRGITDYELLLQIAQAAPPPSDALVERLQAATSPRHHSTRELAVRALRGIGAPVPEWPERRRRRAPPKRPKPRKPSKKVSSSWATPPRAVEPTDPPEWLLADPRRDALRSWARALHVLRFFRGVPLMAATGGEKFVCAIEARSDEERRAVAETLGITLASRHQTVGGERATVEVRPDRIVLEVFDGFEVSPATFERAQRLDAALPSGLAFIDPPVDSPLCLAPSTCPSIWRDDG